MKDSCKIYQIIKIKQGMTVYFQWEGGYGFILKTIFWWGKKLSGQADDNKIFNSDFPHTLKS